MGPARRLSFSTLFSLRNKQINSAREALQHAAMHEQKGLPASASTILTIGSSHFYGRLPFLRLGRCFTGVRAAEMVKISAALKHFTGMPSQNSRILEDGAPASLQLLLLRCPLALGG